MVYAQSGDIPIDNNSVETVFARLHWARNTGCLQGQNVQVVFRYVDENGKVTEASNPNGSLENIAGIVNSSRNILGLMPHPERASEAILGSDDGLRVFESMADYIAQNF